MKPNAVDVLRGMAQVLHEVAPGVERQIIEEVNTHGAEIESLGDKVVSCGRAFSSSFKPIGEEGIKVGRLMQMVGKSLQRKR